MTYKIKGTGTYLTLVEAIGPARYYRAWTSDRLDGEWTPVPDANTWIARKRRFRSALSRRPTGGVAHDAENGVTQRIHRVVIDFQWLILWISGLGLPTTAATEGTTTAPPESGPAR